MKWALFTVMFVWAAACRTADPEPEPEPKPQKGPSSVREVLEKRARDLIEQAQANPDDPQAWYALGNAYLDLADLPSALEAYNRALQRNPQFAAAHCNRGLALRRLGDYPAAVAAYQRALSVNPRDPVVLENLASAQEQMGDWAGAAGSVARLLALRPGEPALQSALAALLVKAERYEEALAAAQTVAASGHAAADDYFTLGAARLGLDDPAGALAAWNEALELDPAHARTLRAAAALYVAHQDYANAWNVVRRCERYGVRLDQSLIQRLQTESGQLGPP